MKRQSFLSKLRSHALGLAAACLLPFGISSVQAGTIYWDGTTANWDLNTNWSTASGATTPDPLAAPAIGDDVIFNITTVNAAETISLNGNQAANTLTFNNTGTTKIQSTVADQTLTLASGITVNTGAGAVTIGSATAANRTNVILGTAGVNQSWTLNGATNLTVTNGVAGTASTGNTQTLTINGSSTGTVTFTGTTTAITDGGNGGKLALLLNGTATSGNYLGISLSSANSYSGGTTITQGRVGTNNALNFGAANSLVTVQGTTDGGSGGQAFLAGVTWLYDFNISGFGNNESNQKYALRMLNNTIIGASTNTFTIANAAAIGTSGSGTFTIASKITGTGALTIRRGATSGATAAIFTNANNDYSGQTTLSNATLRLDASTAAQNSIISTGAANGLIFNTGITNFTVGGLSGAGNQQLLDNTGTPVAVALTIGNNNNTGMTYSGVLSGAGGSLIKAGTGTQTLSGASTYTGGTTIKNGTLLIGVSNATTVSGALGTSASAVTLGDSAGTNSASLLTNGAFTFSNNISVAAGTSSNTLSIGGNSANTSTFSGNSTLNNNLTVSQVTGGTTNLTGNITSGASGTQTLTFNNAGSVSQSTGVIGGGTGTIAVTKLGAGTTTLSGANTYTGATNVSVGNLTFAGLSTIGAVSVADSATLGLKVTSPSASVISTQNSNVTFGTSGASSLALDFNSQANPTSALLNAGSGVLTLNGTTNVTLTNFTNLTSTPNNTTLALLTYGSRAGAASFNLTTTSSGHTAFTLNDTNTALYLNVSAIINTWTGGTSGVWDINTASNWNAPDQKYLDGDIVRFDDTGSNTSAITLAGTVTPASVTFDNTTATYAISDAGSIAGTGAVIKNGTGTVTLSTANTYTGGTTINAGTIKVGNVAALGGNAGAVSVANGAVLDLNGTTMTNTNALTLNGTGISSGGALTNSSGTAGTYAGLVTLGSASSIIASSGNITLSNVGTITGSGFGLTVGGTNNTTISSIIGTGAGTLTKQDAGSLTLSGANTYSGGTTVSAGTLLLGNNTAAGTNTITLAGATLQNSAGITNTNAINVTANSNLVIGSGLNWNLNGNITGGGNINYAPANSAATLGFGGDNSGYTGTFTQNAAANNALQFSAATAGSAAAAWSLNNNTTTRTKFGGFSGTINFGSLAGSAVGVVNNTAGTVTMSVGALNTNTTFSGSLIAGTGVIALTKVGTGTLTLSGANTYTGATNVNAGSLNVTGVLAAGSAVTVAGGATLLGSGTIGGAAVISGSLAGTLTLNGNATINSGATAAASAFKGNIVNNGLVTTSLSVQSGMTLSGTGTMAAVTAVSSGTVAPGNAGAGILTVATGNNFSLNSGAHLSMELGGSTAGVTYDQVLVQNGTVNLNADSGAGATLDLALSYVPTGGDTLYLILNGGSGGISGTFNGLAEGSTVNLVSSADSNTYAFTLTYQAIGNGDSIANDVALTAAAIPEPSTWAMMLSGLGLLSFWQRSRRKSA